MGKQLIEGTLNDVVRALESTPALDRKRLRVVLVDEGELATIYAAEGASTDDDMFAEMDAYVVHPDLPVDVSREAMYTPEERG